MKISNVEEFGCNDVAFVKKMWMGKLWFGGGILLETNADSKQREVARVENSTSQLIIAC